MLNFCGLNQENVIRKITNGEFDNVAISESNLADDVILSMYNLGILEYFEYEFDDKRRGSTYPMELIMVLAIAAKMKIKMSLSDIPYAIQDHRVLAKLGFNIKDTEGSLKDGLMRESSLRRLLGKYDASELFSAYNETVQKYIMPKFEVPPTIHILDCTDLEVNLDNANYEGAEVTKNKHDEVSRGYKLGTIRGLVEDTGFIEKICFGSLKTHDLNLTKDMVKNSTIFKDGDVLINDRGFFDRELINFLKNERGVDTYVPLRKSLTVYDVAVAFAKAYNKWEEHPTRENQKIAFVPGLKEYWWSDRTKSRKKYSKNDDVEINTAVVWDLESDGYFVFATTDTTKTAKQIIQMYELKPEIEEDYRQLKDFWLLDEFKSTKLNMIAFHIITVLFGYLFFQIYTNTPEGEKYAHKCLPVVLKNYKPTSLSALIFYAGEEFAILSIIEFAKIYAKCDERVRERLDFIFEKMEKKEDTIE